MLNQTIIHRAITENRFDKGLLAETLLFYSDILLLLDRGSLSSMMDELDNDTILRLVEEFGLKLSYHREYFSVATQNNKGLISNAFVAMKIQEGYHKKDITVKEEIEDVIVRKKGSNQTTKSFLRKLIPNISAHIFSKSDVTTLNQAAKEDICDATYAKYAADTAISLIIPSANVDRKWRFSAIDIGGDHFALDTDIDFGVLDLEYRKFPGQEEGSFTGPLLAAYIFNARADAYFASTYMSNYVCDSLSSALMQRKFYDLIRRVERDVREVDLFQEKLLPEGKRVRQVINSGDGEFSDLIKVLQRAQKFKDWLKDCNPDESLLSEYFKAISREGWLQTLPGKTLRWVTTSGLGIAASAAFSPLGGTLAGLGVNLLDTFLIDKLLKGWRPNHFVEGPLTSFIEGSN